MMARKHFSLSAHWREQLLSRRGMARGVVTFGGYLVPKAEQLPNKGTSRSRSFARADILQMTILPSFSE